METLIYNRAVVIHSEKVLLSKSREATFWTIPCNLWDGTQTLEQSILGYIKSVASIDVELKTPLLISESFEGGSKRLDVYWLVSLLVRNHEYPDNYIRNNVEFGWFSRDSAEEVELDPQIYPDLWQTLDQFVGDQAHELKESWLRLEKQNKELKDTKDAMRVLLDDARELEDELKEERDRIQLIISSMGEGLLVIDKNKRVILINPTAERFLEVRAQEVLHRRWSEIVKTLKNGKETPLKERSFSRVLRTRKMIVTHLDDDHYYKTKSGRIFPVSSITAPLVSGKHLIGAVKVFRDVTKEKEVDKMKTEFISLASHQLRTPLSAMKWFLEMLLNGDAGPLNAEQREYVKNVDESNERMIALVNSLLNISRIESGRIVIDPEMTDLAELARNVIRELEPKFIAKNQKPVVSIHGDLPKINIDPKLIRNVYMNLLTNANKYTPDGGSISVFISKKEKMIVSQVSDTGYGIPEKESSRVFQKFFRAGNVVKKETEGSGLGLYLAKAIIESSGGEIWFDSKEGEGTSFWFSLPLAGSPKKEGEVALND